VCVCVRYRSRVWWFVFVCVCVIARVCGGMCAARTCVCVRVCFGAFQMDQLPLPFAPRPQYESRTWWLPLSVSAFCRLLSVPSLVSNGRSPTVGSGRMVACRRFWSDGLLNGPSSGGTVGAVGGLQTICIERNVRGGSNQQWCCIS
jgi:hypothetical protein